MTPESTTPMSIKERIASFGRALEAKELAGIFGVTEALIYKQARTGAMPNFRIGTLVRFDPKAVCEWYDRQ
jgi:predicted DNA-binding transcriptional regulator AlpA